MSSDEKESPDDSSATAAGSTPRTPAARQLSDAIHAPADGHGADIEPLPTPALKSGDDGTPDDGKPGDDTDSADDGDPGDPSDSSDSNTPPMSEPPADDSPDIGAAAQPRPAAGTSEIEDGSIGRGRRRTVAPADDDGADLWEPAGSFGEDPDAPYLRVRRSSPGWAIAKWMLSGLVTAAVIILSFIMVPRLFTPENPQPAPGGSAARMPTTPPPSTTPPVATYHEVVLASAPTHYWKFEMQAAGSDSVGPASLEIGGDTPVLGASAYGGGQGSIDCSGTPNSRVLTSAPETPVGDFSIEAWINTVTAQGGPIVTFGNKPAGTSSKMDRVLYMGTNGKVYFGTQTKKGREFTVSKLPLNTGTWRHVVGTMSTTAGLAIYVDGKPVNTEKDGTSTGDFEGYWKICAENTWGWPGNSGLPAFTGTVDDISIYPKTLTEQEVLDHYETAKGL